MINNEIRYTMASFWLLKKGSCKFTVVPLKRNTYSITNCYFKKKILKKKYQIT